MPFKPLHKEALTVDGIDYLTASGHKIYAPKGIGFLYKSKDAPIHALIKGGGQELGFRAGTEKCSLYFRA